MKDNICIGLVGAGYAAHLHGNGYKSIRGVNLRLKTVCDIDLKKAMEVKEAFSFEQAISNYEELLNDPEIDVVDIVTPPFLHTKMAVMALNAGKHCICEKPLTGYYGHPEDPKPIGFIPKSKMYAAVLKEMDELKNAVDNAKGKFFYAENRVYAPMVQKAAEYIAAKKSKILFMKAEGSLKGSSSPVAGEWEKTGGGTLIRVGSHSIAGVLYLKQVEAAARGEIIGIESVVADTAKTTSCLSEYEHRHISARPNDVEDYSTVNITFTDGTKALVISTDTVLGGTKNYIEAYCNDGVYLCNIVPNDLLSTYFLDEDGIEDKQLSEMLPSKLGWNKAFVAEEIIRGHMGELQDFMETIALDKKPICNFDIAYQSIQIVYAAYVSSEENRRVFF